MGWTYDKSKVEEKDYTVLPVGNYKIKVAKAEAVLTQTGKDMWKFTFDVEGDNRKIFYNLVFLPDYAEMTNQKLFDLYNAFGVPEGVMNPELFIGKVGECKTKITKDDFGEKAEIHYFVKQKQKPQADVTDLDISGMF